MNKSISNIANKPVRSFLLTESTEQTRKRMMQVVPQERLVQIYGYPLEYYDILEDVKGEPTLINYFYNRIRSDFRNVLKTEKFIPGIFRIALTELGWNTNQADKDKINNFKIIVNIISENDKDNYPYDWNLNNLSYDDLWKTFGSEVGDRLKNNAVKKTNNFKNNGDYDIVEINSYEEAHKFGNYSYQGCRLCYTQNEKTFYNQYHALNPNRVYVCLKKGWKRIKPITNENTPFDEYGLSMIFVFISPDGSLAYCNIRWNHEHCKNFDFDHILTPNELSGILGGDFHTLFPPYTREELNRMGITPFADVSDLLKQGVSPDDIFIDISKASCGFSIVELNGKYNYLSEDNKLLSNKWFDIAEPFSEDYASVAINRKWNFIGTDGEYLSDQWFDYVTPFANGYAKVSLNKKWNMIDTKGELRNIWVDKTIIDTIKMEEDKKRTFYITEDAIKKVTNTILTEAFVVPRHEQVRVVCEYLDKNFLRSESDDIDENGYPCKVKSVTLMSSSGKPLKPMSISELLIMLDDKFINIIKDKAKRRAFLKQVITDWYFKSISKEGLLSVNTIPYSEKGKKGNVKKIDGEKN